MSGEKQSQVRIAVVVALVMLWTVGGRGVALSQEPVLLDGPEQEAMSDTVQHALEYNPSNQASEWVNPDTGRAGGVVPLRTFENAQGQPCREFITTITIGGKEEQGYGTACRQPDGSWEIVSDDTQGSPPAAVQPVPAAPAREVYVYPPPPAYYVYPDGFYGSSRIYVSYAYVYRSGHIHHGRHYLDGRDFYHRHPRVIRERVFVGPRVYEHYRWRDRWEHRDRDGHRGRGDDHRDRDDRRGGDDRGGRDDRRDRDRRDRDDRRGGDDRRDRDGRWPDPDRGGGRGRR